MELGYGVSMFFRAAMSLFSDRPAVAGLLPISMLCGAVMLWVFGKTSDQEAIRKTKNRLKAHMLEMRLFTDEPVLVLRAQKNLIIGNGRLLALTLRPALYLIVPMILLFVQLESFYGRAPLRPGEATLVTVQLKNAAEISADPVLEASDGIVAESAPVRVVRDRQISWRIRAGRDGSGHVRVRFPDGAVVEKSVETGPGPRYVSDRRVSSWSGVLWHPGERRLAAKDVDLIEVHYPSAYVSWLGVETSWVVFFLVVSMITALLLKKRMGIAF